MTRRVAVLAVLLAAGGWTGLRQADPDVDLGNQAYRDGRYDEALRRYQAAEERGADARLHFDQGAALYKLADKNTDPAEKERLFGQAEEEFRRAADTDDDALKSSAYFNLGNTLYQRRQWEDAIASYKRALRADPKNDAARHNLEMALRQREKQQQKQPQQGQKGQKGQKGDPGRDRQDGQGQPDRPQDQDGQRNPDGRDNQDSADGQPQGQNGQDGQSPDGSQNPAQPPPAPPQGQGQGGQDPRSNGQDRRDQDGPGKEPPPQPNGGGPRDDPPGDDGPGGDSASDQDRKLDELERRSRDLRRRLLRQSGRNRDPMRLPSRRDW